MSLCLHHVVFTNELQKYKWATFVLHATFFYTKRSFKSWPLTTNTFLYISIRNRTLNQIVRGPNIYNLFHVISIIVTFKFRSVENIV